MLIRYLQQDSNILIEGPSRAESKEMGMRMAFLLYTSLCNAHLFARDMMSCTVYIECACISLNHDIETMPTSANQTIIAPVLSLLFSLHHLSFKCF